MPFARPTLSGLIGNLRDDFSARFPGADSTPRRSVLDVFSRVIAGALSGLYGYLDWIARQVMPDTAEDAQLERWASIWGLQRIAATSASGPAPLTGTNGSPIPAGTVVQRPDGVEFATTADVVIAGGVGVIALECLTPGDIGNTSVGTALSFVSPVDGVESDFLVGMGGIAGGFPEETDDQLRARLLRRIAQPPQGGSAADYDDWTHEALLDVTRVFVLPLWNGPGSVGVTFMCDGRDVAIPTGDDVDAVQAYFDARRPVTATATAFAPVASPRAFTLTIAPDTADNRAAVSAELDDLFTREATPGGTVVIEHIQEAIGVGMGDGDFVLTSPSADVTAGAGHITTLGVITW